MSVAQLGEHIGENFEELVVVDLVTRAYLIYIILLVPVESISLLLIVEETVVLIDDAPQGFEVSLRGVFILGDIDA